MLRFASVTVNLGPTFLSGALAANAGAVMDEPSCPLVQVTGGRLGFLNFDIYLSLDDDFTPFSGRGEISPYFSTRCLLSMNLQYS